MLARQHRFHGLHSLNYTYRQGRAQRGSLLALRYSLNKRRQTYRLAVVVSRKVDKSAVVRNRIRRRIYEAVRAESVNIAEPYDLIFTVYSSQLAEIEAGKLQQLVQEQLKQAGVFKTAGATNPPPHAIVKAKD